MFEETWILSLVTLAILITISGFCVEIHAASIYIPEGEQYYNLTSAKLKKYGTTSISLSSILIVAAIIAAISFVVTEAEGLWYPWVVTVPVGITWFVYMVLQMKLLTKKSCQTQKSYFTANMNEYWQQNPSTIFYQRKFGIKHLNQTNKTISKYIDENCGRGYAEHAISLGLTSFFLLIYVFAPALLILGLGL